MKIFLPTKFYPFFSNRERNSHIENQRKQASLIEELKKTIEMSQIKVEFFLSYCLRFKK